MAFASIGIYWILTLVNMQQWHSLLLALAMFAFPYSTFGCDICGCGSGSNPLGLLPLMQRHSLGMRYSSQVYYTTPHGSGRTSNEAFQTLELSGRYQLNRRTQFFASIPYKWNNRYFEDQSRQHAQALSDVSWSMQYQLFDSARPLATGLQHQLLGSIGMKLPTGPFDVEDNEGRLLNFNLQPGSGSYWMTAGIIHALTYQSWGILQSVEGAFSNRNPNGYQKGSSFQYGCRLFYQKKCRNGALLPQLGLQWERSGVDKELSGSISESGGRLALLNSGVDVLWKQWMLGFQFSLPIRDHLARGYVAAGPRWSISTTYFIGKKTKKTPTISIPGPTDWVQPITI